MKIAIIILSLFCVNASLARPCKVHVPYFKKGDWVSEALAKQEGFEIPNGYNDMDFRISYSLRDTRNKGVLLLPGFGIDRTHYVTLEDKNGSPIITKRCYREHISRSHFSDQMSSTGSCYRKIFKMIQSQNCN